MKLTEDTLQKSILKSQEIWIDYNIEKSVNKIKTVASIGKYPVRSEIVIDGKILGKGSCFKYSRYGAS
jgi:hypothetical protein